MIVLFLWLKFIYTIKQIKFTFKIDLFIFIYFFFLNLSWKKYVYYIQMDSSKDLREFMTWSLNKKKWNIMWKDVSYEVWGIKIVD